MLPFSCSGLTGNLRSVSSLSSLPFPSLVVSAATRRTLVSCSPCLKRKPNLQPSTHPCRQPSWTSRKSTASFPASSSVGYWNVHAGSPLSAVSRRFFASKASAESFSFPQGKYDFSAFGYRDVIDNMDSVLTPEDLEAEEKFWSNLKGHLEKLPTPNFEKMLEEPGSRKMMPVEELRMFPLGYEAVGKKNRSIRREELLVGKISEEIEMLLGVGNLERAWDVFMEMRREGLVGDLKSYEHMIAILVAWRDDEGVDHLLEEMDTLGYSKGQSIYTNLVIRYFNQGNFSKAEEYFQEMRRRKYDIPNMLWCTILDFYVKKLESLDKILDFYRQIQREAGMKDANAGNVMLDLCRVNGLYDLADKLYEELEAEGLLYFDLEKNAQIYTFEQRDTKIHPKAMIATETYLLMCELNCGRKNLEKVAEFRQKINHVVKITGRKGNPYHHRVYEALLDLYDHHDLPEESKKILEEVKADTARPPISIWRRVFRTVLRQNNIRSALKLIDEFESGANDYDETMSGDLISFWMRVKDYRRAKNTYDSLIKAGISPSIEARTAMIQVYGIAGQVDDVQRFYDDQIRSGIKMPPAMHEVMIEDYLKRNYPGSARDVLERIQIDGHVPSPELVARVCNKYAELGGINQVTELIQQYFLGPTAKYRMTAEILAASIKACLKTGAGSQALDNWEKYSKHVVLSEAVAVDLITSLRLLKANETAFEVYERFKKDKSFKEASPSIFEAALNGATHPSQCDQILSDMSKSSIPIDYSIYMSIFRNQTLGIHLDFILQIAQDYVRRYYPGCFNQQILLSFFGIVAKYDFGQYKREARAWIKRISVSSQGASDGIFLAEYEEPTDPESTSISTRASYIVHQYILAMDPSKFFSPMKNRKPIDTLFSGSDIDLADILVNAYGMNPDIVSEVIGQKERYEKLENQFIAAQETLKQLGGAGAGAGAGAGSNEGTQPA